MEDVLLRQMTGILRPDPAVNAAVGALSRGVPRAGCPAPGGAAGRDRALDKAWIIAGATALLDPEEARQAEAMVLAGGP